MVVEGRVLDDMVLQLVWVARCGVERHVQDEWGAEDQRIRPVHVCVCVIMFVCFRIVGGKKDRCVCLKCMKERMAT